MKKKDDYVRHPYDKASLPTMEPDVATTFAVSDTTCIYKVNHLFRTTCKFFTFTTVHKSKTKTQLDIVKVLHF